MKLSIVSALLASALVSAAPTPATLQKRATVQGFDISHYQSNVNFQGAYNSGARFVIIKVGHSLSFVAFPCRNSLALTLVTCGHLNLTLVAPRRLREEQTLTNTRPTGYGRYNLQGPFLLLPLYRCHLRRPDSRRLSLCSTQFRQRCHTGQLLPR